MGLEGTWEMLRESEPGWCEMRWADQYVRQYCRLLSSLSVTGNGHNDMRFISKYNDGI